MRLTDRRHFTGMFEKYSLLAHNHRKMEVGQMKYMMCIGTCLRMNSCDYFKHGNETAVANINHDDVKDCAIWTRET